MKHLLPVCICAFLLTGCRTIDLTEGQSGVCEVHHIQMTKRTVPITIGGNLPYDGPRERFYPHPGDYAPGSCFPVPYERANVYVCSKCEAAKRDLTERKP
jgi:hypothetical protein